METRPRLWTVAATLFPFDQQGSLVSSRPRTCYLFWSCFVMWMRHWFHRCFLPGTPVLFPSATFDKTAIGASTCYTLFVKMNVRVPTAQMLNSIWLVINGITYCVIVIFLCVLRVYTEDTSMFEVVSLSYWKYR